MKLPISIALLLLIPSSLLADQEEIRNYRIARDVFVYNELYPRGGRTLYCDEQFSSRAGLNVEHVLPASWMKDAAGCQGYSRSECRRRSDRFNFMEADLHNLWPTDAGANSTRSDYQFAVIGQDVNELWQGSCDFEVDHSAQLVEPRPAVRGEIARMVLYMVKEYGIVLPGSQYSLMVEWHCTDNEVSPEEVRRNEIIARIQRTRNQFIDEPTLLCTGTLDDDSDWISSNSEWEDCRIKGNISANGEKIFHTSDSKSYESTKINTATGERWFCTEQEALEAGWRAPRNR